MTSHKCAGTNRHGRPCKCRPICDSTFCRWHGPNGNIAKYRQYIAEQQIAAQLQSLESTAQQWETIEWLTLRLNPNAAQLGYLIAKVCGGPVSGPRDVSRDQADALIEKLRYHADRTTTTAAESPRK